MWAAAGGFRGEQRANTASIDVYLVDKNQRQRSIVQITNRCGPYLASIPEARTSIALSSASFRLGFGGGSSIQIQLSGPDIDTLTQAGQPGRRSCARCRA